MIKYAVIASYPNPISSNARKHGYLVRGSQEANRVWDILSAEGHYIVDILELEEWVDD